MHFACYVRSHGERSDPRLPRRPPREARRRAAAEGESLNAYLRRELTKLAEEMTIKEWLAEVAERRALGDGLRPRGAHSRRSSRSRPRVNLVVDASIVVAILARPASRPPAPQRESRLPPLPASARAPRPRGPQHAATSTPSGRDHRGRREPSPETPRSTSGSSSVAPAAVEQIWALRDRLTAYDAAYVALAQALDATVLTLDSPPRPGRAELASVRLDRRRTIRRRVRSSACAELATYVRPASRVVEALPRLAPAGEELRRRPRAPWKTPATSAAWTLSRLASQTIIRVEELECLESSVAGEVGRRTRARDDREVVARLVSHRPAPPPRRR